MTQIKDPQAPATPAQASYLADLVAKRDLPAVAEKYRLVTKLGVLQKGQASEWITALLAAPVKAAKPVKQDDGSVAMFAAPKPLAQAVEEIAATLTELPAFGYYQINGDLYYWDVTGKDYSPQLRKLAIVTTYSGAKKGSWKKVYAGYKAPKITATYKPYGAKSAITPKNAPVSVPQVLVDAVLAGTKPLTQSVVGTLGKQFGFCVRCGATLTDPVSVANGIGPVCATYWA